MIAVHVFKTALINLLQADAAVVALASNRIYDEAPEDQRGVADVASPYAYLGPIHATRLESDGVPGWTLRLRLYAASTSFGRSEAWSLMDAICAAIDGKILILPAPYVHAQQSYVASGGDVIDALNPKLVYVDLSAIVAG